MFSDYELSEMRDEQELGMPELVTIKRAVKTSDGFGGYNTTSYTTVATDVPARITPSQELVAGGQADRQLQLGRWSLRVPYGTDLQERDQVEWTAQSMTIEIEQVKSPRSYHTAISAIGEVIK